MCFSQKEDNMHFFGHLRTITKHRHLVVRNCFKAGIGFRGLFHDLSKYSPAEFIPGMKYWTGKHSPIRDERADKGYSLAWMHHKGRNKHHYEYWVDMDVVTKQYVPVSIPDKYIKEMVCDRIAASKVYLGKDYTDAAPLEYETREKTTFRMHPDTQKKLEFLLNYLAENGEKALFSYLREHKTL